MNIASKPHTCNDSINYLVLLTNKHPKYLDFRLKSRFGGIDNYNK